ncbi:hypothetical protein SBRCBS47491_000634 [Sporothrix bragantina]|uniref:Major facilitator superfamily (MFS) profile domain-containing protein n=1 Tax=Sporothrix bragantina TaxID=671064 RepID=A0ABP0AS36_9PEZI
MDPAPVLDIRSIEEERSVQGLRKNGIKAKLRILAVSFYMGIALLEYGFDQAMPGFLRVFGYQEPNGSWGIHAMPQQIISSFMTLGVFIGSLFIGPIGSFLGCRHSACCRRRCCSCRSSS